MNKKSPKVLSVCTSDSNGGAARAAYRIHLSQRLLGINSQMFVKKKGSNDPNIITLESFIPHRTVYKYIDWFCNKIKNKLEHFRWKKYPLREKVYMSDLRGTELHGALQKLDYDVLHLHWINQRFISINDLPQDKPIIWTLHDSWPFCGICHYFLNCKQYKTQCGNCQFLNSTKKKDLSYHIWRQKMIAYKKLDLHIVTPSQWLSDCAKESSLLSKFPISVIPNCLDTNVFRPIEVNNISTRWKSLQKATFGKKIVLYGAIKATSDKVKGYTQLIRAIKQLELTGNNDIALVVFGAKHSDLTIHISIPIHYVGFVKQTDELVSLYNLADVMVVPSLSENLSCAIMESLSCETPVVAFNIGGNGDMIDHKSNGYLAKEQDGYDLADGILWCLNNNAGNKLGKAGREKVLHNYTPSIVGEQYKQLYLSVYNEFLSKWNRKTGN